MSRLRVRKLFRRKAFREVIRELALHIENAAEEGAIDATTFANLYLEMMRDPRNEEVRQCCAFFITHCKVRSWDHVLFDIFDLLDRGTIRTFLTPEAVLFYNQFKRMVLEQLTDYWEQFIPGCKRRQRNSLRKEIKEKINYHHCQIEQLKLELAGTEK